MKTLIAIVMAVVLLAPAVALAEGPSAENIEYLVGKWQGDQIGSARRVTRATYLIQQDKNGALAITSAYVFQGQASKYNMKDDEYPADVKSWRGPSGEGRGVEINGSQVSFWIDYSWDNYSGGRLQRSRARYTLTLEGNTLKGQGFNQITGSRFDVELKKVE